MAKNTRFISGEPDGASAIAHELDTINELTTDGAKLWSIKNAGIEKMFVDKDGFLDGYTETVLKPGATAAEIEAAIEALSSVGGGILTLAPGEFVLDDIIGPTGAPSNVIIRGSGQSTVLKIASGLTGAFYMTGNAYETDVEDTVRETKVFTCSTVSDASNFQEGDSIFFYGDDEVDSNDDYDFNEVAAAGNPTTGEVTLKYRISRPLTNCRVARYRGLKNIVIQDLKIINESTNTGTCLGLLRSINSVVRRVTIEGAPGSSCSGGGIFHAGAIRPVIEDCEIRNINGQDGIELTQKCLLGRLSRNSIQKLPDGGNGIILATCYDILVDSNIIKNNSSGTLNGFGIQVSSGKRLYITNNHLRDAGQAMGIYTVSEDTFIEGNLIHNTAERSGTNYVAIKSTTAGRVVISGNHIRSASNGITLQTTGTEPCAVSNNQCYDIEGIGIYMQGSNSFATGNYVEGASSGIYCGPANNINASSNMLQDCTTGIYLIYTSDGVSLCSNRIVGSSVGIDCRRNSTDAPENPVISGNHVEASSVALRVYGLRNGIVTNNILNGTTWDIMLDNGLDTAIENNIFSNNDMHGGHLQIYNKGTGNDFSHNREF